MDSRTRSVVGRVVFSLGLSMMRPLNSPAIMRMLRSPARRLVQICECPLDVGGKRLVLGCDEVRIGIEDLERVCMRAGR